jgi:type II restriction enzyme
MDLCLEAARASAYTSGLQRARILTEHWVSSQVYCPNCGNSEIAQYGNNNRVGDFYCSVCQEDYELKSQRTRFGAKVADGAYGAMIRRLSGNTNPNLFLLNYNKHNLSVTNLIIIPKHFFTVDIIEERPPLPPTARRAGWVGCRISLQGIPLAGRIAVVRDEVIQPKPDVLDKWRRTLFLRAQRDLQAKGWLVHVMRCIERLGKREFSLDDIYGFEAELGRAHPENQHVRPKIRQKLQALRDNGYLEFRGRGTYRLTAPAI